MPGVGTQSGISVASSTDHVRHLLTGLRGNYDSKPHTVIYNETAMRQSLLLGGGTRQPFLQASKTKPEKVSTGV